MRFSNCHSEIASSPLSVSEKGTKQVPHATRYYQSFHQPTTTIGHNPATDLCSHQHEEIAQADRRTPADRTDSPRLRRQPQQNGHPRDRRRLRNSPPSCRPRSPCNHRLYHRESPLSPQPAPTRIRRSPLPHPWPQRPRRHGCDPARRLPLPRPSREICSPKVRPRPGYPFLQRTYVLLRDLHTVPLAGGDTSESPVPASSLPTSSSRLGPKGQGPAPLRSPPRGCDSTSPDSSAARQPSSRRSCRRGRRIIRITAIDGHPHLFPEPRLDTGEALLRRGLASACIDISDGLSTDLAHLCRASGVSAEIEQAALPIHPLAHKRGPDAALNVRTARRRGLRTSVHRASRRPYAVIDRGRPGHTNRQPHAQAPRPSDDDADRTRRQAQRTRTRRVGALLPPAPEHAAEPATIEASGSSEPPSSLCETPQRLFVPP